MWHRVSDLNEMSFQFLNLKTRALGPPQHSLAECHPVEVSVLREMFHRYTIQYGGHEPHVDMEYFKGVWWHRGTKFKFFLNAN